MIRTSHVAAIALATLLTACASKPYPPEGQLAQSGAAPAPPTASAAALPAASTGVSPNWTTTYPYGTAEGAEAPVPQAAPAIAPAAAPSPTVTQEAAVVPPASETAPSAPQPAVAATPTPTPTPTPAPSPAPAEGELLARATDSGSEPITVYSSEGDDGERTPLAPFVSGWNKPGVSNEQHRSDIEACYRFAWSQVDHDLQIENDVAAARYDQDKGLGFTDLTRRMNLYDHKERRTELINDCMENKGYVQR